MENNNSSEKLNAAGNQRRWTKYASIAQLYLGFVTFVSNVSFIIHHYIKILDK